jgi:hypothetical protein
MAFLLDIRFLRFYLQVHTRHDFFDVEVGSLFFVVETFGQCTKPARLPANHSLPLIIINA